MNEERKGGGDGYKWKKSYVTSTYVRTRIENDKSLCLLCQWYFIKRYLLHVQYNNTFLLYHM